MPTEDQRRGDFSSLLRLGPQYQIYEPATIAPAADGRFSRRALAGNILPASRFHPLATKLLAYYPLPNATGTVVRAGYGISFDSLGSDKIDVDQLGFSQRTRVNPSNDNGLTFRATLVDPYPDDVRAAAGAANGLATTSAWRRPIFCQLAPTLTCNAGA